VAISSGVGPHLAWINLGGVNFPVTSGSVTQPKTLKTAHFRACVPMSYPGALDAFAAATSTAPVNIIVSTRGEQATLFMGTALEVDFNFIKRQIVIDGKDGSFQLHQTKVSQKFQNMPGSQIVQQLAAQAGLSVNIGSSALMAGKVVTSDFVKLADNISIGQVIHKLAEFDGARWWVKNGVLNYQLQDDPSGTYTLNYVPPTPNSPMKSDCLDLSFHLNTVANDGGTVTVKSWHPRMEQVFQGQATYGKGGSGRYNLHVPNLTQDHVQQHAISRANAIGMNAVTARATVVGDPTIDVAMDLAVNGTDSFDGTYAFTSITHDFGMSGHTTHLLAQTKVSGGAGGGTSTPATSNTSTPLGQGGIGAQ
jgi:hypothetical protein